MLALNSRGSIDLPRQSERLRRQHGWDIVLHITDLPHFQQAKPVVAEVALDRRAAELCLPALGVLGLQRLTAKTLARIVAHLRGRPVESGSRRRPIDPDPGEPDSLNRLIPMVGTTAAARREPDIAVPEERDVLVERVLTDGLFGQIRLWAGMVLAHRPWRMPLVMTTTMAAASAVGADGVFHGSIWVLSDAVGSIRQLAISVMAVAAMTTWLIATNGLWVRAVPGSARRWAAMDNAATVATVGSSFDDDAIRDATYSGREGRATRTARAAGRRGAEVTRGARDVS